MCISENDWGAISVMCQEMKVFILASTSTMTWHAMLTKDQGARVITAPLLTDQGVKMVLVVREECALVIMVEAVSVEMTVVVAVLAEMAMEVVVAVVMAVVVVDAVVDAAADAAADVVVNFSERVW